LKIAVEAATGQRVKIDVFGPTIHAGRKLHPGFHSRQRSCPGARAALRLSAQPRSFGDLELRLRRGYSVLETIEAVRRSRGAISRFNMQRAGRDIMTMVADTNRIARPWIGPRNTTISIPSPRHALTWEEKLFRDAARDATGGFGLKISFRASPDLA